MQNFRVIRQQSAQMMWAVSGLTLSGSVSAAMRDFGGAYEVPVCQAFLRGHQMAVITDHVPGFRGFHLFLATECVEGSYTMLCRKAACPVHKRSGVLG
jgi:hypothetical protein